MVTLDGLTIQEVKTIEGYSMAESKSSLEGVGKGEFKVRNDWELMDNECKARCVGMDCKNCRRMMVKLRGGMAELRIETGRWRGLKREERICKNCRSGEVERWKMRSIWR